MSAGDVTFYLDGEQSGGAISLGAYDVENPLDAVRAPLCAHDDCHEADLRKHILERGKLCYKVAGSLENLEPSTL